MQRIKSIDEIEADQDIVDNEFDALLKSLTPEQEKFFTMLEEVMQKRDLKMAADINVTHCGGAIDRSRAKARHLEYTAQYSVFLEKYIKLIK